MHYYQPHAEQLSSHIQTLDDATIREQLLVSIAITTPEAWNEGLVEFFGHRSVQDGAVLGSVFRKRAEVCCFLSKCIFRQSVFSANVFVAVHVLFLSGKLFLSKDFPAPKPRSGATRHSEAHGSTNTKQQS